jgi:hypothetical protein
MATAYQITNHGDHTGNDCQCEIRPILSEHVWCEPRLGDHREGIIILRGGWMLAERVGGATTARNMH